MVNQLLELYEQRSSSRSWVEIFDTLQRNAETNFLGSKEFPLTVMAGDVIVSVEEMMSFDEEGNNWSFRSREYFYDIYVPSVHVIVRVNRWEDHLARDFEQYSAAVILSIPFNAVGYMAQCVEEGWAYNGGWSLFDYTFSEYGSPDENHPLHRFYAGYQVAFRQGREEINATLTAFLRRLADEDYFWLPEALRRRYAERGILV